MNRKIVRVLGKRGRITIPYTDEPLIVINALPVGTWPKNFKTFRLKDTDWSCGNIQPWPTRIA